jgi:hypothetical protein
MGIARSTLTANQTRQVRAIAQTFFADADKEPKLLLGEAAGTAKPSTLALLMAQKEPLLAMLRGIVDTALAPPTMNRTPRKPVRGKHTAAAQSGGLDMDALSSQLDAGKQRLTLRLEKFSWPDDADFFDRNSIAARLKITYADLANRLKASAELLSKEKAGGRTS